MVYKPKKPMSESPSLSASPSSRKFLRPTFSALKSPIPAGIRDKTSALR